VVRQSDKQRNQTYNNADRQHKKPTVLPVNETVTIANFNFERSHQPQKKFELIRTEIAGDA
jgi:hypothetical protein